MSLYVVERENPWHGTMEWLQREIGVPLALGPMMIPEIVDPNARDGEWHAVVSMPHEVVEHDGYAVPAWEGDVERREWEARRAAARPRSAGHSSPFH